MPKYRVYRSTNPDAKLAMGSTYEAPDARTAVALDEAAMRSPGPLGVWVGTPMAPVVGVAELVPVPESEWR